MDVTPQTLRTVTFREKLRGYHPQDVDDFLERVADGVAQLQARLDDAMARAEAAPPPPAAAPAEPVEMDDAVKRTLVLAQRTADLALQEAREEAARLVADAQDTAVRVAEEAQRQLRDDIERLDAARSQLEADVNAMQQYVEQERARLRAALAELAKKVETSGRRTAPPPSAAQPDVPPPPRRPSVPPTERKPQAPTAPPAGPRFDPAPPPRREPVPPPVVSTPMVSRPAAEPPSGPPPGPGRSMPPVGDLETS